MVIREARHAAGGEYHLDIHQFRSVLVKIPGVHDVRVQVRQLGDTLASARAKHVVIARPVVVKERRVNTQHNAPVPAE